MLSKIKSRLSREAFLPSSLAIVTSPMYLLRSGLYRSIATIAPQITGDILDFGCGSKPYEILFTNRASYIGVDIEISGHRHDDSKTDVYYDGRTIPFQNDRFDGVVAFEVFEHVFNLDEILSEIRRVLKPEGTLLMTIPFAWQEHEAPYDFARYTSYGIKSVLERNSLEVVRLEKTTTYVAALCQMLIAYLSHCLCFKSRLLSRLFQALLIFPLNLASLFLDYVLPKRYEYFCNTLAVAKKTAGPPTLTRPY